LSLTGNPFGDASERATAASELEIADSADPEDEAFGGSAPSYARIEVKFEGEVHVFDDCGPTTKLIEHLEAQGLHPPFSCREGQCSTCAIKLLDGEVKMLNNEVLDETDLDEGIRLACQSLPVTDLVRAEYE
jgi:3-ketosteroid 9alpha-monooxygenase subunit B